MVDASNPNYPQMMERIQNIHLAIAALEHDINYYVPSGVAENYKDAKDRFLEQLGEVEFLVTEWANKK